jgi:DNA-binding NtrC family response regulator
MENEKIILFADPEGATSGDLSSFLRDRGCRLVVTKTLRETLLILQHQRVEALVLDSSLLEEECEFISVIKGIEKDLPIIICAESNTPELESKIRKQKIFYYHIKSFGTEDLEMALSSALKGLPQ